MKKKVLHQPNTLKIVSCLFGYALWTVASSSEQIRVRLPVAVVLDDLAATWLVEAPSHIDIHIQGSRSELRRYQEQERIVHIQANDLCSGHNTIVVSSAALQLPPTLQLVQEPYLSVVLTCNEPNQEKILNCDILTTSTV